MKNSKIVKSVEDFICEMQKELLELQAGLYNGSGTANNYISGAAKRGKSYGIHVDKSAAEKQLVFLSGMIHGLEQVRDCLSDIEGVMEE